jgi:hypothetical protein
MCGGQLEVLVLSRRKITTMFWEGITMILIWTEIQARAIREIMVQVAYRYIMRGHGGRTAELGCCTQMSSLSEVPQQLFAEKCFPDSPPVAVFLHSISDLKE